MTKQAHRLCDLCYKENQYLEDHIKENGLVFGTISDQGVRWCKKITGNSVSANFQVSNSKNSGRLTKDAFKEMWDSYNYSLR